MVSSTWEFLNKLNLFIFKPTDCMIRFDVVSLFTNVALIKAIDIILIMCANQNQNLHLAS